MKYISTLIFAVALAYSWSLVHREAPINFETHASLQLKMVDVIRESILKIKPTAQNIEILDIKTEALNDHSVKAFFSYKFQESDTESSEKVQNTIRGEATLTRTKSIDPSQDQWSLESVKTEAGEMNFENGIVIAPVSIPGEDEGDKPNLKKPILNKSDVEVIPENPNAPVYE